MASLTTMPPRLPISALPQRPPVRRTEPEPEQMAAFVRVASVLESGAVVEDLRVVEELHVPRLEAHPELDAGVLGDLVEQIEGGDLAFGERRYLGQPADGLDIAPHVVGAEPALMPVEHRHLVPGRLSLRYLAAPIEVERSEQLRSQLRRAREHLVVERDRAHDGTESTLLRLADAEQAHDVAGIGVEELAVTGLVGAGAIVVVGPAEVDDVAEQVSHRILRHRPSEEGANPPERDGPPAHRIALDRQPPDQYESAAAQQLFADRVQHRTERRQREVFPADTGDWPAAGIGRLDRGVDLGDRGLVQDMYPVVALADLVGAPRIGTGDRPARHRREGSREGLWNRRHGFVVLLEHRSRMLHSKAAGTKAPAAHRDPPGIRIGAHRSCDPRGSSKESISQRGSRASERMEPVRRGASERFTSKP